MVRKRNPEAKNMGEDVAADVDEFNQEMEALGNAAQQAQQAEGGGREDGPEEQPSSGHRIDEEAEEANLPPD